MGKKNIVSLNIACVGTVQPSLEFFRNKGELAPFDHSQRFNAHSRSQHVWICKASQATPNCPWSQVANKKTRNQWGSALGSALGRPDGKRRGKWRRVSDSNTGSSDGSKDRFEQLVNAAKISLGSNNTCRFWREVSIVGATATSSSCWSTIPYWRYKESQPTYRTPVSAPGSIPWCPGHRTSPRKTSSSYRQSWKEASLKKTLLQG